MAAETIATALGGHRAGASWMARCPAHDDQRPSLSISDGKDGNVLVFCHAGLKHPSDGLWPAMVALVYGGCLCT